LSWYVREWGIQRSKSYWMVPEETITRITSELQPPSWPFKFRGTLLQQELLQEW
jgi:hypothetical protein